MPTYTFPTGEHDNDRKTLPVTSYPISLPVYINQVNSPVSAPGRDLLLYRVSLNRASTISDIDLIARHSLDVNQQHDNTLKSSKVSGAKVKSN